MSDTPRTDALTWKHQRELNATRVSDDPMPILRVVQQQAIESMAHARQLERELAAAKSREAVSLTICESKVKDAQDAVRIAKARA